MGHASLDAIIDRRLAATGKTLVDDARVAKRSALMAGRYAHAKQFKRCNRELRFLRARLGRLIRDIGRKIDGDEGLKEVFAVPLSKAMLRWSHLIRRSPRSPSTRSDYPIIHDQGVYLCDGPESHNFLFPTLLSRRAPARLYGRGTMSAP